MQRSFRQVVRDGVFSQVILPELVDVQGKRQVACLVDLAGPHSLASWALVTFSEAKLGW